MERQTLSETRNRETKKDREKVQNKRVIKRKIGKMRKREQERGGGGKENVGKSYRNLYSHLSSMLR